MRQHDDDHDRDHAENDHAVAGIFGQVLGEQDVDHRAENRSFDCADAADDDDKHDADRPVDAKAAGGKDRALVEIEDGADDAGKESAEHETEQLGAEDVDTHAGGRVSVVAHCVEAEADLGLEQQENRQDGDHSHGQGDVVDLGRSRIRPGFDRHAGAHFDEIPAGKEGLDCFGRNPGRDREVHAAHAEEHEREQQRQDRRENAAEGDADPEAEAEGRGHNGQGVAGQADKALLAE